MRSDTNICGAVHDLGLLVAILSTEIEQIFLVQADQRNSSKAFLLFHLLYHLIRSCEPMNLIWLDYVDPNEQLL